MEQEREERRDWVIRIYTKAENSTLGDRVSPRHQSGEEMPDVYDFPCKIV
jgi:hypothetical protein